MGTMTVKMQLAWLPHTLSTASLGHNGTRAFDATCSFKLFPVRVVYSKETLIETIHHQLLRCAQFRQASNYFSIDFFPLYISLFGVHK